jgi:flagellar basal body-associated protein FliL
MTELMIVAIILLPEISALVIMLIMMIHGKIFPKEEVENNVFFENE